MIQLKELDDCRRNCEKPDGWDSIKMRTSTGNGVEMEEEKNSNAEGKCKIFISVFWCLEWVLCWAKGVLLQAIACVSPSKQSHIIFIFSLSKMLPVVDICESVCVCVYESARPSTFSVFSDCLLYQCERVRVCLVWPWFFGSWFQHE